jgi:hypothetical protein
MTSSFRNLILLLAIVLSGTVSAEEKYQPGRYRVPSAASSSIRVDGLLDEAAWDGALSLELNYEVRPAENRPPPVRTICLLLYDQSHIYVAFRAMDPAPSRIRAHYADRDSAWHDDFVGIVLDTFNDRRRAFGFYSNPLGVQTDAIETDTGEDFDPSWDAIWDSSGRVTPEGFIVEFAIPWSSLRFAKERGDKVFGFDLVRSYPREVTHHLGFFPRDRSRSCYLCQAEELVGFAGASPGLNLELDPTLTAGRRDEKSDLPEGATVNGDVETDLGLSARWGITPNLSLNGALNPDFSQVEADVAQLEVNERFALFYEEKRPFFMEGADYFTTPFRAVHTRVVADPSWGIKLTGKQGANALGLFVADDDNPGLLLPANQRSAILRLEDGVTSAVARWRRDVGKTSTIGLLASDRRGGAYRNTVYGADGLLRLSQYDTVQFQALRSATEYPESVSSDYGQPEGSFDGSAYYLSYAHNTRDWGIWAEHESISGTFRADLGFMPRVDVKATDALLRRRWWSDGSGWFNKIQIAIMGESIETRHGELTDQDIGVVLDYEGPRQLELHFHPTFRKEFYDRIPTDDEAGKLYDSLDGGHFSFSMQPTGDLRIGLSGVWGGAIDYANARHADITRLGPELTYRLGRHLSLGLQHELERLRIASGRLYEANLSQSRIVYQFNRRAFLRAILQYLDLDRELSLYDPLVVEQLGLEASERQLFTQLLFSYKINPQTVFFLGYSDNRFADQAIDLTLRDRTLFFKLGYAWLP